MADHLDAPGLNSPAMDARVDITDLYVFQKPGDPSRSILILNVNPLAPSHANEFRSDARYEILVDTDGDARPDVTFRIRFTKKTQDGHQFARVVRIATIPTTSRTRRISTCISTGRSSGRGCCSRMRRCPSARRR
jgi:hypothetical protein